MKIFQPTCTFFTILVFLCFAHSFAQNGDTKVCGNNNTSKIAHLDDASRQVLKSKEQAFFNKRLSKSDGSKSQITLVPVKFHIIRDSHGHGGLSKSSIESALDELNAIFDEVHLNFYVFNEIDFIDDDNLNTLTKGNESPLINNYVEGVINLYLADEVINSSGSSICGYNLDNINKNIIILKNSCAVNGSSLAHEIGHFFSLSHTHGNGNHGTDELVDGTNCDTTGDGICDTPADPGLSYDNVDEHCNYTGDAKDAHGHFYAPDTGNVMSYSRKSCRDHFTFGQYARMYAYYLTVKDDIFQHLEISTTTTAGLENVNIYPNPVTDNKIFIKRDEFLNETLQFEITNLAGQILFKGFSNNDSINVSQLPSGSYFLTLSNAETKITKRFIK